jgi:hypothetical protein
MPAVVGTTTSTPSGTIYDPPGGGFYNGVGRLILPTSNGTFSCTGSLLGNGTHILTAAHCIADGSGNNILQAGGTVTFPTGEVRTILSSTIGPGYTGDLTNGADIAILTLDQAAGAGVTRYNFLTLGSELNQIGDFAGYGRRGAGATGYDTAPVASGVLRVGQNMFEVYGGALAISNSIALFDFDNGTDANDAFQVLFGPAYANLGIGAMEAIIASGDSGGPMFIGNTIVGVASFVARASNFFGQNADVDGTVNSSFGELAGFTRTTQYAAFLQPYAAAEIPEPSTWLMLGAGLGFLIAGRVRGKRNRKL